MKASTSCHTPAWGHPSAATSGYSGVQLCICVHRRKPLNHDAVLLTLNPETMKTLG